MSPSLSSIAPLEGIVRGLKTYGTGVRWLRDHPRYLAMLVVPVLIGLLFLIGGISLFAHYDQTIVGWVLFTKPERLWLLPLYYVCQALLYVAVLILTFVASLLVMNVVAAPIYEVVSVAVEKDVTGLAPPDLGFAASLAVMVTELKKVGLILFISIGLLMVPGLNIVASLFAAFLVGWDFFDYPSARRGWTIRQRWDLVRSDMWAVLGLGLWLVIPVLQIVMLPLAVAGGTLLNIEAQRRHQHLTPFSPREDT